MNQPTKPRPTLIERLRNRAKAWADLCEVASHIGVFPLDCCMIDSRLEAEAAEALELQRYADIEHEHLGCPVAETGIYAPRSETSPSILDTYIAKVERDAEKIKALRDKLDELCGRIEWKGPGRESNLTITVREARALIESHDRIAAGVAFITDERLGGP